MQFDDDLKIALRAAKFTIRDEDDSEIFTICGRISVDVLQGQPSAERDDLFYVRITLPNGTVIMPELARDLLVEDLMRDKTADTGPHLILVELFQMLGQPS